MRLGAKRPKGLGESFPYAPQGLSRSYWGLKYIKGWRPYPRMLCNASRSYWGLKYIKGLTQKVGPLSRIFDKFVFSGFYFKPVVSQASISP